MEDRRDYSEIKQVIQETVNDKINKLHVEMHENFDSLGVRLDTVERKIDRLEPVSAGLSVINNLKRFLVWLGVPILVAGAWVISKIKGI